MSATRPPIRLRALTTLQAPSSGTARVLGLDVVRDAVELRSHIGLISHNPLLYPDLSAEENLVFFADMYGVDDVAGRVRALIMPEINAGQMVLEVQRCAGGACPVHLVSHLGGSIIHPATILRAIEDSIKGKK